MQELFKEFIQSSTNVHVTLTRLAIYLCDPHIWIYIYIATVICPVNMALLRVFIENQNIRRALLYLDRLMQGAV